MHMQPLPLSQLFHFLHTVILSSACMGQTGWVHLQKYALGQSCSTVCICFCMYACHAGLCVKCQRFIKGTIMSNIVLLCIAVFDFQFVFHTLEPQSQVWSQKLHPLDKRLIASHNSTAWSTKASWNACCQLVNSSVVLFCHGEKLYLFLCARSNWIMLKKERKKKTKETYLSSLLQ